MGTKLTPYTGSSEIRQDGTVLDRVDINGGLDIYANNVTIKNSRITSADWWGVLLRENYSNLKILHCTFIGQQTSGKGEYAVTNFGYGYVEVANSNFTSWQDAIDLGAGYVHDNYVHDVASVANAHTNAFMSEGGSPQGLRVIHNTLLNFDEQTASGALSLFPDSDSISNVTVEDNWLAGGSYTLYGGERGGSTTSKNVKILNNVFSPEHYPQVGYYGPVTDFYMGGPENVFEGNVFANGRPVVYS
ncbi:hypothetical protein EPA93_08955 [Ktedonosporobacter rubrisoli]|uniref:Right-handed parallel beta-helix repeat-containing protein n=1 Tax=Ktedonosporobacter rubrisoli TaxID=2509675 RepID=A0A4P6JM62_KTERU|nr:hypothetical protein [Ktedonosporobacter rubrisoli]QBD76130.1 hypothetical protein EPA93_08955 [Ktedonosporobacter rubrisoli]